MSRSATVLQVSDTHLSRRHGWFSTNWRAVLDEVHRRGPDLLVNSGDVSVNGADEDDDLAFALSEHRHVTLPWRAIPGNHDVGEEPEAVHLGQIIDAARLARYRGHGVADHWLEHVAEWRLIGLNSQLMGTGLPEEGEQLNWLADALASGDAPTGVFLHKPLFIEDPDDATADPACVLPAPRQELLDLLLRSSVGFVASGHLHEARIQSWEGINLVWCPSTAFPATEPRASDRAPLGWGTSSSIKRHRRRFPPADPTEAERTCRLSLRPQ